eukprot:gnl/MRDRNA2_/MRDRNA2_29125_c0_seq1.p1 gnl/MRDRNA2_/MRDRNA2_29125_c0~~gnl/MRDRNA2_/MRDRNA2_29125_c0_seq1.p1  ORF type:complete len:510 (+),score=105.35 gnl/MRDRNA2_/MRDRNA2_29125_c0_seq1:129-1658(+)
MSESVTLSSMSLNLKTGASLVAQAVGSDMSADWLDDEEAEPTNPYRILHIQQMEDKACTTEEIESCYQSHKELLGEDQASDPAGVLLHSRLERAFSLLMDAGRRERYDQMVKSRKEEKSWAILRYQDGLYEGNVRKDSMSSGSPIREGKGVTILVSGDRFEGTYQNNKKQGFGTQFWTNGDVYRGYWEDDKMHGRGEYYYSSGSWYAGSFHRGKRHGDGYFAWPNGDTYDGQFVSGQRTGKGDMTFAVGGSYKGKWRNGQEHGEGMYASDAEGSYTGQFADGCFHGTGLQILPNNDRYEGQFISGKRTGTGVYDFANGDRYEGCVSNNQRIGKGIFTSKSHNLTYDGQWQDNMPEGAGTLKVNKDEGDAFEYEGQWEGGLKEGKGTLLFPSGSKYTGDFVSDLKHGQGLFEWKEGSQWEGTFSQDLQHGMGMYRDRGTEGKTEHLERYYHGLLCKRDGKLVKAVPQSGSAPPAQEGSTLGTIPDEDCVGDENTADGSAASDEVPAEAEQ